MKFLKTYENLNGPKVGDYVICEDPNTRKPLYAFIKNRIGKIVEIDRDKFYPYIVRYNNIPEDLIERFSHPNFTNCRDFKRDEILYFSSTKEELENLKKYNI
jgi:hypothetical protein